MTKNFLLRSPIRIKTFGPFNKCTFHSMFNYLHRSLKKALGRGSFRNPNIILLGLGLGSERDLG
jgi:hypothetical protein